MISRALIYPARPRQAASSSGGLSVFCKSNLLLFWGRQGRLCEVRGSAFREALGSLFPDLLLWIHCERREDVCSWDEDEVEK